MRLVNAATLAALGWALTLATPAAAGDATGTWVRPNGASQISITNCGGNLCGKIAWLKTPRNDTQNPDASKRDRPLVGVQIIRGMQPTGKPDQWKGKLYNAEDGKTYTGYVQLSGANKMKLEGCVLGGLICKGETWTRVK